MSRLGRSLVVWAGVALATASAAADDAPKTAPEPSEVRVQNIEVRLSQAGPVVLLRVGNKAIPVFVDALVAESIQGALIGQKPPRPLSHDLMHTILQALDAKVSQVVITQKDGIFYGALTIVAGKTARVFDSRRHGHVQHPDFRLHGRRASYRGQHSDSSGPVKMNPGESPIST